MFYRFWDQAERQDFGGGDFLELQYCKLPAGTELKRIVAVDSIVHWLEESLYIDGDETGPFFREYGDIFDGGVYANLKTGPLDWCGINYYDPALTERIIAAILEKKPPESTKVLLWLYEARNYNGFYILGV